MSYADRNSNPNQKILTGGIVALIQGGVALALINGFAVTIFRTDPPPHLQGQQIQLEPLPKPTETPSPKHDTPRLSDPVITAPIPQIAVPTAKDFPVPTQTETLPLSSGTPDGIRIDPAPTATPSPRFQPRGALPRNDTSSWVTTLDYPTADLRAEHQGTVRFQLDVDARGRVSQCSIVSSSGYSGLDEATCKFVSRRARFEAATNADGDAVAGTYMGTIRWIIPRD
ncbi:protein TonB [Novosphingobium sp. PhB165]|uniref:energy transducer TonB n=1 Tax=Novosphingobium sp. PhB165 TaxID=2485105 RepID=UPI00104465F2|nr:energy transducer TonB [Novosphingobium sp. PhB165]TCM17108.1 protein TonB [Novosphingobium sp. PhB165]